MLLADLCDFIKCYGVDRPYIVAYSGGMDSHVLLSMCAKLRETLPIDLRAIHVNHSISSYAYDWANHCQRVCDELQVELISVVVDATPPAGESVENYARIVRYDIFAQFLMSKDMLLTAHHQDDQAETLLLQLLRGSGIKGLSAMPLVRPLGSGHHGRPLLHCSHKIIEEYAKEQNLLWVEDDLNANLRYPRNYLRRKIMPALRKMWPAVSKLLSRTALHCAEAQRCLDELASEDLSRIAPDLYKIPVHKLLTVSVGRQKLVIRHWLGKNKALLPSMAKLREMLTTLLSAGADKQPRVVWGNFQLRRYQDDLYLLPAVLPPFIPKIYQWDCQQALSIPGSGTVRVLRNAKDGLDPSFLGQITVRFRQYGEKFLLPNGKHYTLKKFFQEQKIPPWMRGRIPLLYVDNELAVIPGFLVVEKFLVSRGKAAYAFDFIPSRNLGQNDLC